LGRCARGGGMHRGPTFLLLATRGTAADSSQFQRQVEFRFTLLDADFSAGILEKL
jgi:hypothetical protein